MGGRKEETGTGPTVPSVPEGPTVPVGPPPSLPPRRDADLPEGAAIGRYRVLSRLGEGGMGVVYAAFDPELDRQVAIKLVRFSAGQDPTEGRARLLLEAKAMARLAHPNVVAVHDAGRFQDQVFLAMELVPDAVTAREWVSPDRDWREVVEVYLAAGRGIAAAHQAGIIHRDVKPPNILIDKNGRVRVTDFGIARAEDEPAEVSNPGPDLDAGNLTRPGTVMGTPAYMAPELFFGAPADARSDQFSFAVALWDALYGERPYARNALLPGSPTKPGQAPRGTKVPAHIRSVLMRALCIRPEDRFPSMESLLEALSIDREAKWRRRMGLWGVALLGAMAVLACGWLIRDRDAHCATESGRIAQAWRPERKLQMQEAFQATGSPLASDAFARAAQALDVYASTWATQDKQSCEAVSRNRSDTQALLQTVCLGRRLTEMEALTGVLAKPEGKTVERAVEAVAALAPISACSDATSNDALMRAPSDPAMAEKVARARIGLAEVSALESAGRQDEALTRSGQLVAEARSIGYAPVTAEALFLAGIAKGSSDKAAEPLLAEAEQTAEEGGADWIALRAATTLVCNNWVQSGAQVANWNLRAQVLLKRLGSPAGPASDLEYCHAWVESGQGRLKDALGHYREVLAMRKATGTNLQVAQILQSIAGVLLQLGDMESASQAAGEAVAGFKATVGPAHPNTVGALDLQAEILSEEGDYAEARRLGKESQAAIERVEGKNNPIYANSVFQLAELDRLEGETRSALEGFRQAKEIYVRSGQPRSPNVALAMASEGQVHLELGEFDAAAAAEDGALGILADQGDQYYLLYAPWWILADIRRAQKRYRDSEGLCHKALANAEKSMSPDSSSLAQILLSQGLTSLAANHPAAAMEPLERAFKIEDGRTRPHEDDAQIRFALARALWASGGDHDRARLLARQAAEGFGKAPPKKWAKRAEEAAAWARAR